MKTDKITMTIKKSRDVEVRKKITALQFWTIVDEIQIKTGWLIRERIKKVIDGVYDSISISKNRPRMSLHIGKLTDNISFRFSSTDKNLEIKMPIEAIK